MYLVASTKRLGRAHGGGVDDGEASFVVEGVVLGRARGRSEAPVRAMSLARGGRVRRSVVGWLWLCCVAALAACTQPTGGGFEGQSVWTRAIVTAAEDVVEAVAVGPAGEVVVGGRVGAALVANQHQGESDAFVMKRAADGSELWRVQFGTAGDDAVTALAIRTDGDVIAVGYREAGPFSGYQGDAFVRRLAAADGSMVWDVPLSTAGDDAAAAVALDGAGRAFVVGSTRGSFPGWANAGSTDVFVARVGGSGVFEEVYQTGTLSSDEGTAVVVLPGGDVLAFGVAGETLPGAASVSAEGDDAFTLRLAPDLGFQWVVQLGATGFDVQAYGAALGSDGDVRLVGQTYGPLEAGAFVGDADVFVARVSAVDGAVVWLRQVGSAGYDDATAVAVDDEGRAWVVGDTNGDLAGPLAGERGAFVLLFGEDGALLHRDLPAVGVHDAALAVAVAGDREIVVGGWSAATMPGFNPGWDGFVVRRRY
jgi:hypothetical protein